MISNELYFMLLEAEEALIEYGGGLKFFGTTLLLAGAICFVAEKICPAQKNTPFLKKDFRKELGLAVFNMVVSIPLFTFIVSVSILVFLESFAPYQAFDEAITQLPVWVQIPLALMLMDFSTYWRHRFTHNYLWPYHSIHHSAEEITWLTALRLHPVDYFAAILFDTVIMYFLGFSGEGIVTANMIMMGYNYFTHTNLNISFPKPLNYILASPHFHRWHHATDKAAYDKNFCGMFSLYDVIFGTYHHPEKLPEAYGLSPQDQQHVPPDLLAHLLLPIKKDLKKLSEFLRG